MVISTGAGDVVVGCGGSSSGSSISSGSTVEN